MLLRTIHRKTLPIAVVAFFAISATLTTLSSREPASASTAAFAPIADTYVLSTSTATNFGTDASVKHSGATYRGFIRFDTRVIPTGSTVNSVTLKLYGTSSPTGGGIRVHPEIDTWTEAGTTWATQPTWNTKVLATSATPVANTVASISVPVSSISPGSTTSLGFDYSVSGVVVSTASRESAHPAQLVVDFTAAATAPGPFVTTGVASTITSTGATVSGSLNPNGAVTACHFAYGTMATYGSVTADQTFSAGTTVVPVAASLNGLSADTGYNFRLECTNSSGTGLGSNATFSTPVSAPDITTGAATDVTATGATVAGSVNPNGITATCRFDYGSATSYGSQTTVQNVAAGSAPIALTATLSNLLSSTTYNYRLECTNSAGTFFGKNSTLTTQGQVTAATATLIPSGDTYITSGSSGTNYGSKAILSISQAANRAYLQFDTTAIPAGSTITSATLRLHSNTTPAAGGIQIHPSANSWSEGTLTWAKQPSWNTTVLGTSAPPTAGAWLTVTLPVTGVTIAGATSFGLNYSTGSVVATVSSREDPAYKPQLIVNYQAGTTSSTAPTVTTGSASNVGTTGADVAGTASDNGAATTCRFDFGLTTLYGSQTPVQNVATGSGTTPLTAALTGLTAGSAYHYRLACTNNGGTGVGSDASVTTAPAAPTAVTGPASATRATTAVVSGTAADNGLATTCAFAFGTTTDYGSRTPARDIAAGAGATTITASLTSLTESTAYNYRLECTNAMGTTPGANATFMTGAPGAVNNITKVLVIVEENHGYTQLLTQMPYLNGLAHQYGYASNFHAIRHPSLPNYLAMSGGSTFGITTDCTVATCPITNAVTVFDQAIAAGRTGKVYAEDMTSNCQTSGSGLGLYAVRHTAWPYFTDPTARANCNANQVPAGTYQAGNFFGDATTGNLPNVGWLIPNLCNDAHNGNCLPAVADGWLQNFLSVVFAGPDWASGHLAIVVTTDEDDGSEGNQVLTVVIHPDIAARVATSAMDLYSITRFLEQVAGVTPYLNNAATAADLGGAFGLAVGP